MCKPGHHFKLCTCSKEEIDEENFWRLWRVDTEESEEIMIVGLMEPPQDYSDQITIINIKKKILEDINKHNSFDFEYAPVDSDKLEITLDGLKFSFQYKGGKFVEEEEDYHPTQHKWVLEGRIDVS